MLPAMIARSACRSPSASTCIPFCSVLHALFSNLVPELVRTRTPPTMKERFGQLPPIPAMNPVTFDPLDDCDGVDGGAVGARLLMSPSDDSAHPTADARRRAASGHKM